MTIVLTVIMVRTDTLRGFESLAQDIQTRLSPPPAGDQVALVVINDSDYRTLFNGASPLDPRQLQTLLTAIAKAKPKVIGVDIDTSDRQFSGFQLAEWWPPTVWARAVYQFETDAGQNPVPERPIPRDILGGGAPWLNAERAGVPALIDVGNMTRFYQRLIETSDGMVPSFPWAVATTADPTLARRYEVNAEALMIRFAGDAEGSHRTELSALQVLRFASEEWWQSDSPLKGKVVLLGGSYIGTERQDQSDTPLGEMYGVRILASVVETELEGGGVKRPGELALLPLWALQGLALVLVFSLYPLRKEPVRNLTATLLLLPLTAVVCSLLASRSLAYWSYFIPIGVGVLAYQLLDQLNDWRKEKMGEAVKKIVDGT